MSEEATETKVADTFAPKVGLVWATPNLEQVVLKCARVSSADPDSQDTKLIGYLIANRHWSPFEMATVCLEIETTRDIARQILRHRSFSFQEFSQRYQVVANTGPLLRDARTQNKKRRQCSDETDDLSLKAKWVELQREVHEAAYSAYSRALADGVAKEIARCVLPEGMTQSKMYMSGTLRSWLHYCDLRCGNGTQLEHQAVAEQARDLIGQLAPSIAKAMKWPIAEA